MMRLWRVAIVLGFLLTPVRGDEPIHPTAVFTLDVVPQSFPYERGDRLDVRFRQWAQSCKLKPSDPLFVLDCPRLSERAEGIDPTPSGEVSVAVALFRDLDENLYIAGCPLIEDPTAPEANLALAANAPLPVTQDRAPHRIDESGLRLQDEAECHELEAGQTFSVEVEKSVMRIVFRGRQLPLTLLALHPKRLSLGDPRPPRVSPTPPSSRSAQGIDPTQLADQPEPDWSPPSLDAVSSSVAVPVPGAGVPLAKTALRTGRLVIECARGPAEVYIDEAYMGLCPLDMPLVAGPHSVTVKRAEGTNWVRDFRVVAGKTIHLEVNRGPGGEQ